eukprot:TRINITY_DN95636_c0_g1_i1.p1 TRINITY_DN95636_c0_g1~~TRINITY_DN95636_c0_g1_i1.p1  ORF type:complete len:702 (-),score=187.92 TRINITY_DN95636_c0_g1_i1:82-2187(-)
MLEVVQPFAPGCAPGLGRHTGTPSGCHMAAPPIGSRGGLPMPCLPTPAMASRRPRLGCQVPGPAELTPRARQRLESTQEFILEDSATPASPRRFAPRDLPARSAAREQRRLELERELCEKLGVNMEQSLDEELETDSQAYPRPRSATSKGLLPPRPPPKPKPHRSVLIQDSANLAAAAGPPEEVPTVKRWKSALTPLWPDRAGDPAAVTEGLAKPEASPRCSLSKTAPAAMSAGIDIVASCSARPCDAERDKSTGVERRCAELLADAVGTLGPEQSEEATPRRVLAEALLLPSVTAPGDASESSSPVCKAVEDKGTGPDTSCPAAVSSAAMQENSGGTLEEGVAAAASGSSSPAVRVRLLEESSKRLREKAEQLRSESRRQRIFGPFQSSISTEVSRSPAEGESPAAAQSPATLESNKRLEEMRRKLVVLDELNAAEQGRLESEQREAEERRQAQEAFERNLQEQVQRNLREHREREAREAQERAARDDEARLALQERKRRQRERQLEEQQRSRQLEEQRKEGRSEASQSKWQQLEEELEKQWAEQEAEERRRVDDYARDRRRQFDDWERRLAAERQRFASEAEFCAAARHHKARHAAHADEQFYSSQRQQPAVQGNHASPPASQGSSWPKLAPEPKNLSPEERALFKELQSVQGASRELQKAKVKDLLFRWHPDKNPDCPEKAKQLFQFVQQQRKQVLGL